MLSELESQNDDQASEMSKKVKMLKDVSGVSPGCEWGWVLADGIGIAHNGDRRRDPRQHCFRREDERLFRRHAESITRDYEQNAADGGENGCGMANLAGFLRVYIPVVCICEVILISMVNEGKALGVWSTAHTAGKEKRMGRRNI